jgi:sarcosine oxidase subunit alpha
VPPRRTSKPARPVTITLDGKNVVVDQDCSIASGLVGAGELVLARSPKFHRPRGPSCLRGGCDGCLMRVDGVPNVMTCLVRPEKGTRVERQNVILSAKIDVLRATDWFFPDGMNHHVMFAGVPGVSQVMQAFARRVSGLGALPEKALPPKEKMSHQRCDVLVVGGGPAGLAAAAALQGKGLKTLLIDDQPALGGSLLAFPHDEKIDRELSRRIEGAGAHRLSSTVMGVLEGDDWLVDDLREGLVRVEARAHVIAAGAHDATPLFEGNDLPGVLSARAAGRLLRDGVLVGERIVVTGDTAHARAFAEAARAHGAHVERVADVASVRGLSRVRTVHSRDGKHFDADAVVHDAPRAPCFEVAVQAGGETKHTEAGYSVRARPESKLFAIGEVTGIAFDLAAFDEQANTLATAIAGSLA